MYPGIIGCFGSRKIIHSASSFAAPEWAAPSGPLLVAILWRKLPPAPSHQLLDGPHFSLRIAAPLLFLSHLMLLPAVMIQPPLPPAAGSQLRVRLLIHFSTAKHRRLLQVELS